MEELFTIGILGTPVGLLLYRWAMKAWRRWTRWHVAIWQARGYVMSGEGLMVGVRRGRTRMATARFRANQADTEGFAVALAEAKSHASSLNAASRTTVA